MIFVFAALDTGAGYRSFYDSNLQREPSHPADEQTVDRLLAKSIGSQAAHRTWSTRFESTSGSVRIPATLVPSSIRVNGLEESSELPEWTVSGEFASARRGQRAYSASFQMRVSEEGYSYVPLANGRHGPITYIVVNNAGSSVMAHQPPMAVLFPGRPDAGVLSSDAGALLVGQRLSAVMTRYFGALRGDPLSQSGAFWRMFYFSATTATTLGFGDITPLTSAARLLVTLEAIIGVVLVGLFLASLSARSQRNAR